MRNIYKLTDINGRTYGGTQWAAGVTHTAPGKGQLCTSGWIHWYPDPLVAVFMDPIQGKFGPTARLWHGTADGVELLEGSGKFILKGGSQTVTLIEELPLPMLTTEQRVQVAIRVAQHVVGSRCPKWSAWAEAWLSGRNRTEKAAEAAEAVVITTARAAEEAAWSTAAEAAARAAEDAVWAMAAEATATQATEAWAAARATEEAQNEAAWAAIEAATAIWSVVAATKAKAATTLPDLVALLNGTTR